MILGVSPDTVASHVRFKEKYGLPFTPLADPEHRVAEQYDAAGRVVHALRGVRQRGHSAMVWQRFRSC